MSDSSVLQFGIRDFTINLWINSSQTGAGNGFIAKDGSGAGGWAIVLGGAGIPDVIWADTAQMSATTAVNDDTWHMITWTRTSGGNNTLYIDGVVEDTVSDSSDLNRSVDMVFGKWFPTGNYNGLIDEASVWLFRALNSTSVVPEEFV